MILKMILTPAASTIRFFLIYFCFFFGMASAEKKDFAYYSNDHGIIPIMYHRFNENKYPSTNIEVDIFKKHLQLIKSNNVEFYDPNEFDSRFNSVQNTKKILITVDDAFSSFYNEAWPILKNEKIPFILFVYRTCR